MSFPQKDGEFEKILTTRKECPEAKRKRVNVTSSSAVLLNCSFSLSLRMVIDYLPCVVNILILILSTITILQLITVHKCFVE